MLMLNAPAAVKEMEEALKCIQERENADAECICGCERDKLYPIEWTVQIMNHMLFS